MFSDYVKVHGVLTRIAKDMEGNILSIDSAHNMILTRGRESLAILLSDASGSTKRITQMAWGDQGCNPLDPSEPLPVLPEELSLNHEVLRKTLYSYAYPLTTAVMFVGRINHDELVGVSISEAMLISSDSSPFSMQRFGAMYHPIGITFEYRWTIYF